MNRKQMRLLRGLGVDFSIKSRLSNATKIPGELGSYLKDTVKSKASSMKDGAIGMKQAFIDDGYWKSGAIGAGVGTAVTYAILCLKNGRTYEEYKDACLASGETPISKAKYIALPKKKDVKSLLKGAGIGAGVGMAGDALTRDREEEAEEYYFSIKDKLSKIGSGAKNLGATAKENVIDNGYWKSGAIGAGITSGLTYAALCIRNGLSYEKYKANCEASGEKPISKAKYIALPTKKEFLELLAQAGRGAFMGLAVDGIFDITKNKLAKQAEESANFDANSLKLGSSLVAGAAIGGALANAIKRKYDYEAYRIECEKKGEKPISRLQYQALSAENLKAAALGGATMLPTALALQTDNAPVILTGLGLSAIGLGLFRKAMRSQMKYSVYKAICEAKGEKPLSKNIYEDALRVGFIEKSL